LESGQQHPFEPLCPLSSSQQSALDPSDSRQTIILQPETSLLRCLPGISILRQSSAWVTFIWQHSSLMESLLFGINNFVILHIIILQYPYICFKKLFFSFGHLNFDSQTIAEPGAAAFHGTFIQFVNNLLSHTIIAYDTGFTQNR
jgi:hypothetical protein